MTSLLLLFKDPYERQARVLPGLLVALPIVVPLVCVYGAKNPVLTGTVTLLGGCGAIYGIASIARGRGKQLEERLVARWGGMPTTIALRHRDKFLDSVSKDRYHQAIRSKLGIEMPTAEEEANDTAKADDIYIGATKRLRELTRGDKQLLLKENIAYGFHRNMLAMKKVGILTSAIGILCGLLLAGILTSDAPHVQLERFLHTGLEAGLTLLVSTALLVSWVSYFNEHAVRRVGFAYAERLFECLPKLRSTASAKREKKRP